MKPLRYLKQTLVVLAVSLVFFISGCATLQVGPASPATHEVTLIANGIGVTFNAPAVWPSTEEFNTGEFHGVLFFPSDHCIFRVRVNDRHYRILIDIRQEPPEVVVLSDAPVGNMKDTRWYLFNLNMPIETPGENAKAFIEEIAGRGSPVNFIEFIVKPPTLEQIKDTWTVVDTEFEICGPFFIYVNPGSFKHPVGYIHYHGITAVQYGFLVEGRSRNFYLNEETGAWEEISHPIPGIAPMLKKYLVPQSSI